MSGPKALSYHAVLDHRRAPVQPSRGSTSPGPATTHEAAAERFLEGLVLEQLPSVRGITGDALAPDDRFAHHSTTMAPSDTGPQGSRFVAFQQLHKNVPIFGARPTVEMEGMNP